MPFAQCISQGKPVNLAVLLKETTGSCLAYVHRVMDERGKFGEHERSLRAARGVAESNCSFLRFSCALQISRVHPEIDIRKLSMNYLLINERAERTYAHRAIRFEVISLSPTLTLVIKLPKEGNKVIAAVT